MTVAAARTFNVASFLPRAAAEFPNDTALIYKRFGFWKKMSFAQLERLSNRYAHGLKARGITRRHKVLLMVKSGPEFVALTFAIFKIGAQPVLLDPGMGLKMALACIKHLAPKAMVAIRPVHVLRTLFPNSFRSVKIAISVGGEWPGAPSLWRIAWKDRGVSEPLQTDPDADAAILFTSGSTGPAKGVVYRHSIFEAQVAALQEMYGFQRGEIDMPGFPLFALFSTAMGVTCLIPELNPSRPAKCNPAKLVGAIQKFNVTSCQGSPAIWARVGNYCVKHGIRLPSLKRVLTFGAPISVDLIRAWREKILSAEADVHTPYGATEALPVATIAGKEILEETAALTERGFGTCIGRPAPGVDIRIVRITDDPIETWSDDLILPRGEIGEIVVRGTVATWRYDHREEETRAAKIHEGVHIWHRMGDVGYFDDKGRLWFAGRKAHRIEGEHTWFSVCGEGMVDGHPEVSRSALVGVGEPGKKLPVLILELLGGKIPNASDRARITSEVLARIAAHPLYAKIEKVLFHRGFPVDPRHNAKIHREELSKWAARALNIQDVTRRLRETDFTLRK